MSKQARRMRAMHRRQDRRDYRSYERLMWREERRTDPVKLLQLVLGLAFAACLLAAMLGQAAHALTICRDDGCVPVAGAIAVQNQPCCHVTANQVTTPARTVSEDLQTGQVTAYEIVIFRAGFE
jgi:hypothetical protein